jgi:hypothetical protein
VVPELNLGQMVHEVQRAVCCGADLQVCAGPPGPARRIIPVTHAGGIVHQPEQILEAILTAVGQASRPVPEATR